jgi:hypothetical protein
VPSVAPQHRTPSCPAADRMGFACLEAEASQRPSGVRHRTGAPSQLPDWAICKPGARFARWLRMVASDGRPGRRCSSPSCKFHNAQPLRAPGPRLRARRDASCSPRRHPGHLDPGLLVRAGTCVHHGRLDRYALRPYLPHDNIAVEPHPRRCLERAPSPTAGLLLIKPDPWRDTRAYPTPRPHGPAPGGWLAAQRLRCHGLQQQREPAGMLAVVAVYLRPWQMPCSTTVWRIELTCARRGQDRRLDDRVVRSAWLRNTACPWPL